MLVVSKSFFDDAKIPQDLQQTFPALSLHEIKFLLEHFIPDKCVCCLAFALLRISLSLFG